MSSTIELEAIAPVPAPAVAPMKASERISKAPAVADSRRRMAAQNASTSKRQAAVIITCITLSTAIATFLAGIAIVALPTMIRDLSIPPGLALWPVSVGNLACGCTLLLCGSISDVVGSRPMFLTGCLLQAVFSLSCGLARVSGSGPHLIVSRALEGLAASFCLPSAVSLINQTFPPGPKRNIAFASMGGGHPVGFGLGMTLGGVITDRLGWQWGFYITALIGAAALGFSVWQLPNVQRRAEGNVWNRLKREIDWIGIVIATLSLGLVSYVMAAVSGNAADIKQPSIVAMLSLSLALMPAFVLWMKRQEGLGRPALIPNSLWRNAVFSCICLNVFLTTAVFDATEQLTNLYFQNIQLLSPLQAALRLLPLPICGIIVNVAMGLLVHRIRADVLVTGSILLTCVGPVLLAVMQPQWSYWPAGLIAVFLTPVGIDGLYTISNLLITSMFPKDTQGLAGGVFNTLSQIGQSLGLVLLTAISNRVSGDPNASEKHEQGALLKGYRASSWFFSALCILSLLISMSGLRKIGKVGKKDD